jgi:hypothetical protein
MHKVVKVKLSPGLSVAAFLRRSVAPKELTRLEVEPKSIGSIMAGESGCHWLLG